MFGCWSYTSEAGGFVTSVSFMMGCYWVLSTSLSHLKALLSTKTAANSINPTLNHICPVFMNPDRFAKIFSGTTSPRKPSSYRHLVLLVAWILAHLLNIQVFGQTDHTAIHHLMFIKTCIVTSLSQWLTTIDDDLHHPQHGCWNCLAKVYLVCPILDGLHCTAAQTLHCVAFQHSIPRGFH